MPKMSDATYTVRLEGGSVSVDAEGLRQLVASGRVLRETGIADGAGGFVRADSLSVLEGAFGAPAPVEDPWEAWEDVDDLDDGDDEDVLDSVTANEEPEREGPPEPLDEAVLEPLSEGPPVVEPPPAAEVLDAGAVEPIEPSDEDARKLVIDGGRGKVIDFPSKRRASTRGGAEPARDLRRPDQLGAQDLTPLPEPTRRPPPTRREPVERQVEPERQGLQTGHFYLAGLLLAGLLGVGIYVWYVSSAATWTSADPLGHGMGQEAPLALGVRSGVVVTDPTPLVEPAVEGDALAPLVAEIKASMSHDLAEIASPEQDDSAFEDALFFELSAVGVSVRSIELEVLGWREDGVPGVLSLSVDVRSRGDRARELGAVALVFGKYAEFHDFTVRGFQVRLIDEASGMAAMTQLDSDKAAALYTDRMGLVEVLGL